MEDTFEIMPSNILHNHSTRQTPVTNIQPTKSTGLKNYCGACNACSILEAVENLSRTSGNKPVMVEELTCSSHCFFLCLIL